MIIHDKYSKTKTKCKLFCYFFIQIAHTIRQLLERDNKVTKLLKLKIKEVSNLLLSNLTSTISDLNNLETNFQLRFDD